MKCTAYIPVIAKWAGFSKITEKEVIHRERKYGTTKFGSNVLSMDSGPAHHLFCKQVWEKPMHFFGVFGTLAFLLGFFLTVYIIGEKIYNSHMR
jgi:hypothetical protein